MGAAVEEYCRWRRRQETGRSQEHIGLENEIQGGRHVCSSFFMLSPCTAQWERRQAGRWRGGGTVVDRETDMMEWQTGRERGREMRKTEWGLQLQYVTVSLLDEAAKQKNQNKTSAEVHRADTPRLVPCMGHYSQLCVWNMGWHMWPLHLFSTSVAGPWMEMANPHHCSAKSPPHGRSGLWWLFSLSLSLSDSLGHLSTHDNPFSTSFSLP